MCQSTNTQSTKVTCKRCTKRFTPSKGYKNFCSDSCKYSKRPVSREAVEKRAAKLRKPTLFQCQNKECGVKFYDKPSAKRKYCSPSCASKVRTNNPEFKRQARLRAIEQGFGGNKCRGHHGQYTSPTAGTVYLESSYEFKVAESLDAHGIRWIRPSKKDAFTYQLPNEDKLRRYEPDFYLPDYDVYLDPKNDYRIKKDRRKIRLVRETHQVKVILLRENELEWPIFSERYIIAKSAVSNLLAIA